MPLKVLANSINTPYMQCHNYIFMNLARLTSANCYQSQELETLIRLVVLVEFTGVETLMPDGSVLPTIITSLEPVTLINSLGVEVTLETVFLVSTTSSRYLPANKEDFSPETLLFEIIRPPPLSLDVAFRKSNT